MEGKGETLSGVTTPAPDVVRIELEQPLSSLPAVAAYLGYKAKVRRIRFHTGHSWAQSGLGATHNRSVPRHR